MSTAVKPHRVVLTEVALDRRDYEADFFPVPQSSHRYAGELTGLSVRESKDFLASFRHYVHPFPRLL
jgi:hypothetical protein